MPGRSPAIDGATEKARPVDPQHLEAGKVIYREGDPSDAIYVIDHGVVEVLRNHDGAMVRLGVLRHGEIFGETGVILHHPRSTTTRALTAVTLMRIDSKRFLEIFPPDNPVALPLLRMLCERLAEANRQIADLSLGSAGAASDEVARMRLMGASPLIETQIGDHGIEIRQLPFTIGRRSQSGEPPKASRDALLLGSQGGTYQISLQHCVIDQLGGTLIVRDLGSALGTLVNGKRIAEFERSRIAPLRFGANEIVIGGADSAYHFTLFVDRK
jgi:CRP-like cAMP-binding protein